MSALGMYDTLWVGVALAHKAGSLIAVRLACRVAAVVGAIALLGPLASAVASPATAVPVAHLKPAAQLKHHRTARLCSAAIVAGQMACLAIRQTDTVQPRGVKPLGVSPNAVPDGYGPSDLAAAYKLDQSKGSGQTVAIVDAYDDPNAASDLAAYRAQYDLPSCTTAGGCFEKVSQSGSTTILPAPDPGWAAEISLDLDMVSATCPNCHILLVEADDNSITNLGAAVNEAVVLGAKFVSNSYGGPEDGNESSYDSAYYHHPGVAITASAGDDGYGAEYPATGGYVTAVGGTSLTSANNARGWTETAWDDTGSGCSSDVAKPSFQSSINTGCTTRAEADVSAVADPDTGVAVYDTTPNPDGGVGWQVYGGTSVASPIIASVYALAGTPGTGDNPNTYPYAHPSGLNDVTSGSNGPCSPAVLCTSGTGWDGPTGLGTPNGTAAFNGAHTIAVTNPGTQTSPSGSPVSLQLQATDSASGAPLTYGATGLPPGLTISSTTGLISGTPITLGTYTVSSDVTDATSASGTATFTWVIQVPGTFAPLSSARVLDTRAGLGAPQAVVGPGADLIVQITGRGGVPASGVSAVVANVTVTQPTAGGWVAVWADGGAMPPVSNLNFAAHQTVPNLVIVPVGSGGAIRFHNGSGGTVQLIADISGYYLGGTPTAAGTFAPLPPARVLDTRAGLGAAQIAVGPGADLVVPVDGVGGVPATGVSAVVVNVTVAQPTAAGWASVWADGGTMPPVSSLNFTANQSAANLAVVSVGSDGAIRFHNGSGGTVQLIADISGYYLGGTPTAAGTFAPLPPARVLDTRAGLGAAQAVVGPGADLIVQITGRGGVPASGVSAVVANVTVTQPTAGGWVAVWADGGAMPPVSNLNFTAHQTVPNLVIVPVGSGGAIRFHNGSGGTVQLIADISGYSLG
jgi:urease beta subunit